MFRKASVWRPTGRRQARDDPAEAGAEPWVYTGGLGNSRGCGRPVAFRENAVLPTSELQTFGLGDSLCLAHCLWNHYGSCS